MNKLQIYNSKRSQILLANLKRPTKKDLFRVKFWSLWLGIHSWARTSKFGFHFSENPILIRIIFFYFNIFSERLFENRIATKPVVFWIPAKCFMATVQQIFFDSKVAHTQSKFEKMGLLNKLFNVISQNLTGLGDVYQNLNIFVSCLFIGHIQMSFSSCLYPEYAFHWKMMMWSSYIAFWWLKNKKERKIIHQSSQRKQGLLPSRKELYSVRWC